MADRYKIVDGDGHITNIILADAEFAASNGAVLAEPNDTIWEAPREVVVQTLFSKLEFMNRLTRAELEAIYTAAKTVVSIEVWLDKFKIAQEIDTTNPDTVNGVQLLETAGLLAAGRANEILGL